METDDQQNVDEEDQSAPRMSRKTKETLKVDLNLYFTINLL